MKKIFTILFMAALTLTAMGQTPGYALYGDVPTDYTDLTNNVTVSAQGTVTKDADPPLTFTGKGLSGSQYCNTSNHLRFDFNAAQPMSLTNNFALHIFIKKAESATGDVQICLCKNGWNANRIPWLIANSAISSDEYSEVVLKYSDRNTSISWNSYGDGNLIGTDVNFEAAEVVRICAANGEQFMIEKIYLEATMSEPDPEPTPELTGEHRYYLYRGGDLPQNRTDELTCYDERDKVTLEFNGTITHDSEQSLFDRVELNNNAGWFVLNANMNANITNYINNRWWLVVRFRTNLTDAFGFNHFRINLSSGVGSFKLNNGTPFGKIYNDGLWQTVSFKINDAEGTKPTTFLQNGLATQIHLDGNCGHLYEFFDIDYIYFTNNIDNLDPGFCEDNKIVTSDNDFYTFYAEEEVAIPSGVTVYTAALNNDQTALQLTEINGNIPAKTGVLVKTSSTGTFVLAATSTGATATSVLSGVSVATSYEDLHVAQGETIYTLGMENGVACFKQATGGTLKAHRAYLRLPAGAPAPASVRISAEENTATSLSADPMVTSVPTKRLVNGQILIEKDGALYYVTGMRAN